MFDQEAEYEGIMNFGCQESPVNCVDAACHFQ